MKTILIITILIIFTSNNSFAQSGPRDSLNRALYGKDKYPAGGMGNQDNGVGQGDSGNSYGKGFTDPFTLKGRSLLNKPLKDSIANVNCRVVLNVDVNAKGIVTNISGPARGSTTNDSTLVKRATEAALKAKFTPVDTLPLQKGMIMFRFYEKK